MAHAIKASPGTGVALRLSTALYGVAASALAGAMPPVAFRACLIVVGILPSTGDVTRLCRYEFEPENG